MEKDTSPCRVDAETLARTTKCNKNFRCQEAAYDGLCEIDYAVGGAVHFIKCENQAPCLYRTTFGNSCICTCPTRKEIFNRYRV